MKDKQNFTNKDGSTFFQAVKTITVLVVICLVCAVLLSLCNDLLYISQQERFNRAMAKVSPGFKSDLTFDGTLDQTYKTNAHFKGEVLNVYKSVDGVFVVESVGGGGFSEGTATVYVAIDGDGTILNWVITENKGQTFVKNITDSASAKTWYVGESVSDLLPLEGHVVNGTTGTSTAVNNAVNMACYYCVNALNLGQGGQK